MDFFASIQDKVVLDVGCGSGILSLFAAAAGAKFVYGVDASEFADVAREIVKDNGMEEKVDKPSRAHHFQLFLMSKFVV